MARLPIPGSDDGVWGDVLNEYLQVSHDSGGTLKPGAVSASSIQDGSVSGAKIQDDSITDSKLNTGSGTDGQVLTKDSAMSGGFKWSTTSGAPLADASTPGLVQLTGDLGGSATSPTVPGLATKANDSAVVHLTGNETVAGIKTFSASPLVPTPSTSTQAANKTYVDTAVAGVTTADATTTSKGIVQLAGDLSGTASAPTVPALTSKANTSTTISAGTGLTGGGDLSTNRTLSVSYGTTAGTAAQGNDSRITGAEQTANKGQANGYASLDSSTHVPTAQLGSGTASSTTFLRGDNSWTAAPVTSVAGQTGAVTLTKSDVGLANVDNTSDANKPVSTAQQSALDGKVNIDNGGGEKYTDVGNSGSAITLNLANGNVQKLTLTANCTITLTSPSSGAMRALTLLVFQDATGSRTITWPASVKWGNAGAPTLTTTASKMDIISLFTVDGGTTWYGALGAKGF